MAQNGHDRSREALRREALARRAALKRTAHALEDRVKEGTGKVSTAIERTRDRMGAVDEFVHRHHLALMAGASAAGLVLGLRHGARARRRVRAGAGLDSVQRTVYVTGRQDRDGSRSLLRSAAGTAAAMALRQAVQYAVNRFTAGGDEGEEAGEGQTSPSVHLPGGM